MSAYAELAVTTNFSFLRGASDPEELVAQAKALGLAGLGIADRNSVAGVVRAHIAARELAAKERQETGHESDSKSPSARGWCSPTARPTSSPIRAIAPPGDGSRACFRSASAAPRRATASSGFRIFWIMLKASISLSCRDGSAGGLHPPRRPDFASPRGGRSASWGGLRDRARDPPTPTLSPQAGRGRSRALLAQLKEAAGNAPSGSPPACSIAATTRAGWRGLPAIAGEARRAADRRQRRALSRAGAAFAAGRRHLHPRAPDAGNGRPQARSQRRAASEIARRKWRGCFARRPRLSAETVRFLESCKFSLEELRNTEYADETRQGYATPQEALVAFAEEGLEETLSRRRAAEGAPRARRRASADRRARLRAVLSDRRRDRQIRAVGDAADPVPGPRLGRQFGDLLLPRHHRRVAGDGRSPVRALRLRRAARAARHRRRFRARAARGGDPAHLRQIRPRARRPRRDRDLLSRPQRHPRRRQGVRPVGGHDRARSPARCGAGRRGRGREGGAPRRPRSVRSAAPAGDGAVARS